MTLVCGVTFQSVFLKELTLLELFVQHLKVQRRILQLIFHCRCYVQGVVLILIGMPSNCIVQWFIMDKIHCQLPVAVEAKKYTMIE